MILAIETSDLLCSVAFWHDARTLLEYNLEIPRQHATLVGKVVEQGLDFLNSEHLQLSSQARQPQLLAVAIGPGSFTGLRIGLSFAQGYCFAAQLPIVGISNHQVLARQGPDVSGTCYTIIEAHRQDVYLARHDWLETYPQIVEHKVVAKKDLPEIVPSGSRIISSGQLALDEQLIGRITERGIHLQAGGRFNAGLLAELAAMKYSLQGGDKLQELEPMYIRPFAGVL